MAEQIRLCDFAHARAGDKGNILSVAVFPFNDDDYDWLRRELTVERVQAQFAHRHPSSIRRYEIPGLKALNFVLEECLEGGVNRSAGLDRHGKSLSYLFLSMELPRP
jgi:hypothetical protein